MNYCLVAVKTPFNNSILTYKEGAFSAELKPGLLVQVPLGKRLTIGVIVDVDLSMSEVDEKQSLDKGKIKEISQLWSKDISLTHEELDLYLWMAKYYHYPVGQLIFESLPKILKRPRELTYLLGKGAPLEFDLNDVQSYISNKIKNTMNQKKIFSKWLIHGITGSGKTAIYITLIQEILKKGESALFLLPEINLTPQFIKMFVQHLNCPIYSYNSSVTGSNKYGLWKLLQKDETPKVIIGVRSSIFLPIKNIGIIIVDEEHDQSFKQDDRCPYNARDIAIKKASLFKIPIVLGSATPTVETYFQFKGGDNYFFMDKRVGKSILPEIKLIDMKNRENYNQSIWPFSFSGIEKIKKVLKKSEQVLIFVNRLGFSNYLQCRSCGHQFICPNCSLNLKYFKSRNEIKCQYCDYKSIAPDSCPECMNINLLQKGFGTEKLYEILMNEIPDATIERFDRDKIKNFKQLESCLDDFHKGTIDILVGTQMLSKGHNFEKVNLVVIFGIDFQLNMPDFRSTERVFQLLTQVSGRSGRFGKSSEVLIHTLSQKNSIFNYVKSEMENFYKNELMIRESCQLPPFSKIIMVYITSRHIYKDRVISFAYESIKYFELLKNSFNDVQILGPRSAIIEKKANNITWVIMVKSSNVNNLHNIINNYFSNMKIHSSIKVKIEVDPYRIS